MDKSSEEWRLECEARYLLSLSLEDRRRMLDGIGKKRGNAELERLKKEILGQFNQTKETK